MYIRQPAHAGTFYPAHPQVLHQMIMDFSVAVKDLVDLDEIYNRLDLKRAAISPHAGYIYSGIVAAASWGILQKNKNIKKFIIIGPAHYVGFEGWAFGSYDAWQTPLGIVKIDKELQEILINALGPQALILDQAHEPEHSIEVQVPFMQVLTQAESFVPVLAGVNADYQLMGQILAEIVQQFDDVGFVFSSDLSHYLPYDVAKQVDSQTIEAILQGDVEFITGERACGYMGIRAYIIMTELLKVKREFVLYLNSGDTAGDKSHVVGYVSIVS